MSTTNIAIERITQGIFFIRGQKVMLSFQLAELYGVEVRALIQAVKRNLERFPGDFMFQLTGQEVRNLKSQFVISSWGGARRALPYAFTEQGIAMISTVLKSKKAIQINIAIMRVFVKLRQVLASHQELADRLSKLEERMDKKDREVMALFEAIRKLIAEPAKPKQLIGYRT